MGKHEVNEEATTKLEANAAYGKGTYTETLDPMIPRVTVRDSADGEVIKAALLAYSRDVQAAYVRKAAEPGADQYSLTVEMNERIDHLMKLIRDVGDGTLRLGTEPTN